MYCLDGTEIAPCASCWGGGRCGYLGRCFDLRACKCEVKSVNEFETRMYGSGGTSSVYQYVCVTHKNYYNKLPM